MGTNLASVLSDAEGQQIYNIWIEETNKFSSFCATDASGECLFPYIGLTRPAGVANTNEWKSLKWTDGNDLVYVDWGSGQPDIRNKLVNLMYRY